MKRLEWIWALGLVALLGVGYGLVPLPETRDPGDSLSEDAGGKRAFYLLTSELLAGVDRGFDSLVPNDPAVDVLVLAGPARYPDRAQWQSLYDWISEGRALVFAARWQDPAVALEPFDIRVVPIEETLFAEDETSEGAPGEPAGEDSPDASSDEELAFSLLDAADIEWRSGGRVAFGNDEAEVILSRGGSPQVVWQPVGDGAIVVCASDYIFSNRSLATADNGLFAFRLLETASPAGPVVFDETLNRAGAPRIVGTLFEDPFRLPTLQILLVTLLFAWMSSRRFGPVTSSEPPARRSLVEHAEALGSLHFRVGSGPSLVASYLEFFRRELGLKLGTPSEGSIVATRGGSGLDGRPEVTRALRAAKSPRLERERVGELIATLARTRTSSRQSSRSTTKETH